MKMLSELLFQPVILSVSTAITCLVVTALGVLAGRVSLFKNKRWRERTLKILLLAGVVVGAYILTEATGDKREDVKSATLHYINFMGPIKQIH